MRVLVLVLVLANAVVLGYIRYAESRPDPGTQIALLQINPDKMKVLKPSAAPTVAASTPASSSVCLEWGNFIAGDAARAATALGALDLGDKFTQRTTRDGYWVYIPPQKNRAEADKKAAQLKALGINDYYIMPDDDDARYAISLGIFRTEEAANSYFVQLRQRGVRSMVVASRGISSSVFVIKDPGDALTAKIAAMRTDFPNAELKPGVCSAAPPVKG